MGDINQMNFVKKNKALIKPPILEVGSKNNGSTQIFRNIFEDMEYIATDMEAGENVDCFFDYTNDFSEIFRKLPIKKYNTILLFSVLEHCCNPFKSVLT